MFNERTRGSRNIGNNRPRFCTLCMQCGLNNYVALSSCRRLNSSDVNVTQGKTAETIEIRDVVWGRVGRLVGSKEQCLDGGRTLTPLVNTMDRSVHGGDAVLSNYFDHLFTYNVVAFARMLLIYHTNVFIYRSLTSFYSTRRTAVCRPTSPFGFQQRKG